MPKIDLRELEYLQEDDEFELKDIREVKRSKEFKEKIKKENRFD